MDVNKQKAITQIVVPITELLIAEESLSDYEQLNIQAGIFQQSDAILNSYNQSVPMRAYFNSSKKKYCVFTGYYYFTLRAMLANKLNLLSTKENAIILLHPERPRDIKQRSKKYLLSTQAAHTSALNATKIAKYVLDSSPGLVCSELSKKQKLSRNDFANLLTVSLQTLNRTYR